MKQKKYSPQAHGIAIKKQFGQHFLRQQHYVDHMIERVVLTNESSVLEIGCGDGFLTHSILQTPIARLWVFEIDTEWAGYVQRTYPDARLKIFIENILDVDFEQLKSHQPWTILANLPYQITFPLMHLFQKNRALLREGVVMIQEEVAQKLVKHSGRGYGFVSLFFQHYFELQLLDKVPPTAFVPPPKVDSRLLYFKPRETLVEIPQEEQFWKFIKLCFHQPRRTLRNNLASTQYDLSEDNKYGPLRAQQMSMEDFLLLWSTISALH